jgi:hypothetical protein
MRKSMIRGALVGVLLLAGAGAGGCQDQLFPTNEPRSQFDRFDAVRDKRAQQYVEDEFGNRKPNLRGRLLTTE